MDKIKIKIITSNSKIIRLLIKVKYFSSNILILLINLSYYKGIAQTNKYEKVENYLRMYKGSLAMITLDSIGHLDSNSYTSTYKYYLARCLKKSDDNKALAICTKEILKNNILDTNLHSFYAIRSSIYIHQQKYDLAKYDINKAIEFNPNEIEHYLNASYLYGELEEYGNCFKYLEKANFLKPKNIYILNNIAYYSSMAKQYKNAIIYINDALKLTKDSIWIGTLLNNRGFAEYNLGNVDIAMNDINEGMKFYPNNSYANYYKALVLIKTGKLDNVCIYLKRAKELGAINLIKKTLEKYCKE